MTRWTIARARWHWFAVVGVALLLWLPRYAGPIDLRWDAGIYYILGTSLGEGKGYKLLNEPGEIGAVQYPPLLPAIVAVHQRILGTTDPTTVGRWLRLTWFLLFVAYAVLVLRFLRSYLQPSEALLASVLCLCSMNTWFLSDLLFPEIPFALTTLLFLMLARKEGGPARGALAYVCAVASYALRTIGIVAFAVWVFESLIRGRYKQAALRAVLALIPVVAWYSYIASVERSYEYSHPAYEYQRAPYLNYNVSYARNVALEDPFAPEKGPVRIVPRVVANVLGMPLYLGEALSGPRPRLYSGFAAVLGNLSNQPRRRSATEWTVYIFLSLWGVMAMLGMAVLLVRRQSTVPLYALLSIGAICLTPFPEQFLRYLMPIVPVTVLGAVVFWKVLGTPARRWSTGRWRWFFEPPFPMLVLSLSLQVFVVAIIFGREHQSVAYVDLKGEPVTYRKFFYDTWYRGFDQAVDYVRAHALPTEVVSSGTPHWIHLRTGLKAVTPPFERDVAKAQRLLDSVPVRYLIVGADAASTQRYMEPLVRQLPELWEKVFTTEGDRWNVYRRRTR